MRITRVLALFLGLVAGHGFASEAAPIKIDLSTIEFPWMNSPARDAVYRLSDHPQGVFVFEGYSINCVWCNRNAVQVDALATDYASEPRVQVIDLGLDKNDRDYRNWIQTHNPNHPVVKDVNKAVWNSLARASSIPQTFVVACDGTLVGQTLGYWGDEEKNVLKDAIAKALETTCN